MIAQSLDGGAAAGVGLAAAAAEDGSGKPHNAAGGRSGPSPTGTGPFRPGRASGFFSVVPATLSEPLLPQA